MPLPETETFNSEFVRTVEAYRCLYDPSLPEYNLKEEADKAWSLIAEKFSAPAADCKVRWKYLRGGLTRYIKKLREYNYVEDKHLKEFYMLKDMQFVIPYLRTRSTTATPSKPHVSSGVDNSQQPFDIKREYDDVDDSHYAEDTFIDSPTAAHHMETDLPSLSARGVKRTPETMDILTEALAPTHKLAKLVTKKENPDLDFFKSILPDMAQLNASQKRRFKLKVLMLLEEMCNGDKATAQHATASPAHSSLSCLKL